MGDSTNTTLICYLVIGLIVGIWLLAGGWQFVMLILFAYVHGWDKVALEVRKSIIK